MQPIFKTAAASVRKVRWSRRGRSPAPTTTGSAPARGSLPPTRGDRTAEVEETLPAEGGRR